jgi:Lon protease-like protein
MSVLPMFPLGMVLLPGAVLPLHVFEPRYRQLVHDLMEGEPEFGVTLIDRGSEVGGGDHRTSIGTVARVLQAAQTPDGRFALVTVGTRRINVVSWLPDDPYPLADVDDWPDEDDDDGDASLEPIVEVIAEVVREVRRVRALAVELGDLAADADAEISSEPVLASYHLSALAPLGPADRFRLLGAPGPRRRLALLRELLADAEAGLRFRLLGATDDGEPPRPPAGPSMGS